ncbi:methylthioribose-1-phosphate isomerase [Durotheca rogersii]|uniref:methylthioribose-1-phosphate isomerase n=1 Tax=Durotheca rogersii TaxID=419775 RepID=UPI00222076FA|nr:methylthioribose-1-phosphate isomerase [Durotheca rogersii]KAI5859607.1 methylthioribose-1-phosphate isomerase [Durotheca rogersii]
MSGLQAIRYARGKLEVLDQLRLPHEHHYDEVATSEQAFDSIKAMRVRGAPAIAIVAALAHGVELHNGSCKASTTDETISYIDSRLDYLKLSRPTAVDLSNAITHLKTTVRSVDISGKENGAVGRSAIIDAYIAAAEEIFRKDTQTNLLIGQHGSQWLLENAPSKSADGKVSVLTHCNTGSLATSGHGTALGIIRSLHSGGHLRHAFCTETRPYNQGSRLTAFELVYEGIPSTLITDSMAGALFATKKSENNLAAVIVGADRVVRNGDTANKIGTYTLAVLAKHHALKFIVAAPTTSIDLRTEAEAGIKIEERKPEELTQISGAVIGTDGKVHIGRTERVATAHQGINVWNPAFDVTPAELIDAVVTERGVVVKGEDGTFNFQHIMPERWAEVFGSQEGGAR